MLKKASPLRVFAIAIGVALLLASGWAQADPPTRIARLGYVDGAVSFSPAGEDTWGEATLNRPLTTGDRLWVDAHGRAEVQIGGAAVRLDVETSLSVLNLDDQIAQLQLTQGTLNLRVRRLVRDQVVEVDTPNLAFVVRQPGDYRIAVDVDGNATVIVVRKGQAEVYGDSSSYVIDARQPYRFTGTDLRDYEYVDVPRPDGFDRWSGDRDRLYDNSRSAAYVSPDVIGYQDLDANGRWRVDATYGNVWVPNRVPTGWAPYRDGHWTWVDRWGWTWVDDAPWGFAVSHYGRWANMQGTWGWVPGPASTPAYYAPAQVAFVGGDNLQLTFASGIASAVAWFALAPREVYRPSYPVSRGYFENINRSNTVINNTVINNVYVNQNTTHIVYVNRAIAGAVVAVPTSTFVQAQPVSRSALRVTPALLGQRPVVIAPAVAPVERSMRGSARDADKPPRQVFERPVIARAAPPAAHADFAAQRPHLAAKPGVPLDESARKELKQADKTAAAPVVKVISQQDAALPRSAPPRTKDGAHAEAAGRKTKEHPPAEAPAIAAMPVVVDAAAGKEPAQSNKPPVIPDKRPAALVAKPHSDAPRQGRADQPAQAAAPAPVRPAPTTPPAPAGQREANAQPAVANDEAAKQAAANEAAAKEVAAKQASDKQSAKEAAAKDAAAKEAAAKQAATKEAATKETAAKQAAAKETATNEVAARQASDKQGAKEAAAREIAAKRASDKQAAQQVAAKRASEKQAADKQAANNEAAKEKALNKAAASEVSTQHASAPTNAPTSERGAAVAKPARAHGPRPAASAPQDGQGKGDQRKGQP
ncbi:MAG: cell envelope integrity protein TolA [Burkholderiaceae bacterium]